MKIKVQFESEGVMGELKCNAEVKLKLQSGVVMEKLGCNGEVTVHWGSEGAMGK